MQKLENLEITKVAFVPEGDNKQANILLFKSKPETTETPTEDTEKEETTIKRVLLAIGKALGLDKASSESENVEKTEPDEKQTDEQTSPVEKGDENKNEEGETTEMRIDKSKLTAEEIAQLDAIEKKAGIAEEDTPDDVGKGKDNTEPNTTNTDADNDIYKGLHPAVAAELKELRKRADAAEDRELLEKAKKYELLGKKPEELAKTFKALKAAGGSAFDDMVGVLDASLATIEKTGAFKEIGKSGSGQADPWTQIEKCAADIMKAAPTMSLAEAIDKACQQHPELVEEYESNR